MHFIFPMVAFATHLATLTFGHPLGPEELTLRAEGTTVDNSTSKEAINLGGKVQPPLCNVAGMKPCSSSNIEAGWIYLAAVSGQGRTCDVGPRTCSRIACKDADAIVLCNDNKYGIKPNCDYLGSYARDIVRKCQIRDGLSTHYTVTGQLFDSDNYNVLVRREKC